jgi:hypothetical protein
MKRAHYAVSVVAAGATVVALSASPALAARVKTHLVVEQSGVDVTSQTIQLDNVNTDTDLTTHLEQGTCLKVFENASDKTYGVTATPDKAGVVEIQTPNYSGQDCDSHSVQTWHLHAVGGGTITLQFDPVTTQTGLQNQMGPAHVTVEVTGFDNGDDGDNPPGHKRPAAPAVANVHAPHGSDVAAKCQAHYGGAKNWRGLFMRDITKWARANDLNKLKKTFSSDDAWATFVDTHVDTEVCTPPTP